MSLISVASPWISNEDTSNSKKRIPSLRKTIKIKPFETSLVNESQEYRETQEEPLNFEVNEERNQIVNEMINKMSELSVENDGSKLADFNPPPNPSIQMKKEPQPDWKKEAETPIPILKNELQLPAPSFQTPIHPAILHSANSLGNYHQVYNPENIGYKPHHTGAPHPYYSKMGIGGGGAIGNDRLMEKINYMIHLLENQENEKTEHATEEFVLYTFLGIFVIFVVDSFSKNGGKYIR